MGHSKLVNVLWIILMLVTLVNAFVAESGEPGLFLTIVVAVAIGFKGRMVVDHFMELKNAHPLMRISMQVYFYVIPGMFLLFYFFPEQIAALTTLR